MTDQSDLKKIYSAFYDQEYPADFAIVIMWLAFCIVAFYLPIQSATLIRIILSLPVIIFIPGYCVVVALFPKKSDISFFKRIMFSLGFSLTVLILTIMGLYFARLGIRIDTIAVPLIFFTLVMVNIAYIRRALLPFAIRFRIQFPAAEGSIQKNFFLSKSRCINKLLNVILILVIIVSIITTVFVVITPKAGEHFTEFFILGENGTANNYPARLIINQNYPMYVGVGNHESQKVSYTIETWKLRAEFDNSTNTTHIMAMDPLEQLSLTLTDNETRIIPYTIFVDKTGYNRIEWLLFRDTRPGFEVNGSNRINASYRDLHLWVNIEEMPEEVISEDAIKQIIITS